MRLYFQCLGSACSHARWTYVDKRIPSRIFFDPVALEQASNIIMHHKGPRDAVIGAGASFDALGFPHRRGGLDRASNHGEHKSHLVRPKLGSPAKA
jgi:hypothetical protein